LLLFEVIEDFGHTMTYAFELRFYESDYKWNSKPLDSNIMQLLPVNILATISEPEPPHIDNTQLPTD